ncbi:MAG TPA: protein kinase [Gemmatimonadaceae bacterium]|nr:protein kinase [Gemmatimonadaceae bacterium]
MSHATNRLAAALSERYRFERELGTGGMATVYLAEDLRHDRKVAIKVLKPELAAVLGADRFVVEIKTTASLQHPHILPLFDSGTADGFLFYVMPYIQGETIREKLTRETQFGVEEAVRIAREVADALDYAHRHGVVHRDIKPENILLHDGRAMVMDFGIALAVSAAAGGRMTETGLSLGTPHYMSPEQATAEKDITGRSDVYSLASVLYEMLAGEPPHSGGSAQAIIMKIITEPAQDVTKYRKSVPSNVAAAVAKALEKLPADRFGSARTFADALADPHYGSGSPAALARVATRRSQRTAMGALAAALGIMTLLAAWALWRPAPPPPVSRYALSFPEAQLPDPFGVVAISDDGSRIFYLGRSPRSPAVTQFWYKSRDAIESRLLAGAEGASSIAVAPDGQTVAVIERNIIRRLSITGGAPTVVAQDASSVSQSVAWLDDNTLVYVASDQKRLMRVPASGGTASVVWTADSAVLSTLTPLPGARGVLFQACGAPCSDGSVWVLDLRSSAARELQGRARAAHYLASGHLVYIEDDALVARAVPFDLESLQIRGTPVPVLDSIAFDAGTSPYLAISRSGTLVMRRGTTVSGGDFDLVWVDRAGRESAVDSSFSFRVTQTAGNFGWALSPDGTRLAIGRNTPEGDDIWIKSLPRGAATRLTFGAESDARPRWTSDGRAVTFVTTAGIFMRRADGAGSDSLLWSGLADEAAFSRDREWLVLRRGASSASAGGRDIFGIRRGADGALTPLIVTPYDESAFALSPDGRWIAYHSDETGQPEVFVRPFPNTNDAKEQISTGGGRAPLWSRDGRELFYLRADHTMMAVPVAAGAEWQRSEPRALFQLRSALAQLEPSYYAPWDIAPDGRFIFARSLEGGRDRRAPLIVIENWMEEVKAKVPR